MAGRKGLSKRIKQGGKMEQRIERLSYTITARPQSRSNEKLTQDDCQQECRGF